MPHLSARTRGLVAAASAVTAAPFVLALAGPAAASGRAHASGGGAATIVVTEHAVTDTEVPTAPGGKDVKGDPLTFVNPVFNQADTRRVGHDEGFCMRLDVSAGTWECLWTTFLPLGEITVQGPFYDTRNSILAITGGTGAYQTARGEMRLTSLEGGKEYRFRFMLK
jgi:allene oxide cyclase